MDKAQLRKQLREILLSMTPQQRNIKSKKACRNLVSTEQFQKASVIMLYLSLPHEVDTTDAILHAWQQGKTVAVPRISWQQRHMIPVSINSLETDLVASCSGLRNPIGGVPIPLEEIDLVVTPALAYDNNGNRLGRGSSYYDRFFANPQLRAVKCGFAFAEQRIESVPVTDSDEPVDMLVTDEEVIYFNTTRLNRVRGE